MYAKTMEGEQIFIPTLGNLIGQYELLEQAEEAARGCGGTVRECVLERRIAGCKTIIALTCRKRGWTVWEGATTEAPVPNEKGVPHLELVR